MKKNCSYVFISHLIYSLWVHVHSFSCNCCADNSHVTIASLPLLNPRSYSIQLLSGLSQTLFFHICSKFTISPSTIWSFMSVFVVFKYQNKCLEWEALYYYNFTQLFTWIILLVCCCITSCPKSKCFNIMSLLSNRNALWGFDLSSDSLLFTCLLSAAWLYFVF